MKTLFLLLFNCFLLLAASGQNRVGIFFGPQATTSRYVVEDLKQKTSMKYGFQLGGMMKVPFEGSLYFVPTIFYSMKGYKVNFTRYAFPPDVDATDNNVTVHTVEICPMFHFDLGKDPDHFFIRFGPSMDMQLFGKESFHKRPANELVSRNMKFSYADYGFVSFNANAQVGYETSSGLSIFAHYGFGMGSIVNTDGGPRIYHRVAGISVGKYINRKKTVIDTRNKE